MFYIFFNNVCIVFMSSTHKNGTFDMFDLMHNYLKISIPPIAYNTFYIEINIHKIKMKIL